MSDSASCRLWFSLVRGWVWIKLFFEVIYLSGFNLWYLRWCVCVRVQEIIWIIMYLYIFDCVCMSLFTLMCLCEGTGNQLNHYVFIPFWLCVYEFMGLYLCVNVFLCVCVCVRAKTFVCMCVCVCVCVVLEHVYNSMRT